MIKVVAIVHEGTSASRLENLRKQNDRIQPLKLELFKGLNKESQEFKDFCDVPCEDPSVKCLMYNTFHVLVQFLRDPEHYLVLVEDDVVFTKNFYPKLLEVLLIWTLKTTSHILRIGLLPLTNVCGAWPVRDATAVNTTFGSKVYFNIQERVVGAQGIVYSKEGARIFLETYTGFVGFTGPYFHRKYSDIIKYVQQSKVPSFYGISSWNQWAPQKVPATDHLLNLETLNQALVIDPLVIESEEGQSSSSCGSMQSRFIWAPLVEKGYIFE